MSPCSPAISVCSDGQPGLDRADLLREGRHALLGQAQVLLGLDHAAVAAAALVSRSSPRLQARQRRAGVGQLLSAASTSVCAASP
jgi:hypothetical protein